MSSAPAVRLEPIDVDDPRVVRAAIDVVRDCETSAVGATEETVDSIRATMTGPLGWRSAHRAAYRGDDLVGVLVAERDDHGREVFLDSYVRGPAGDDADRALMRDGLASALALARANPTGRPVPADPLTLSPDLWQVVSGCPVPDRAHAGVLAGLGFEPIRRFWRMRWDLTGIERRPWPTPTGVAARPVTGLADERAVHRVFGESFAEHFGSSHDRPFEEWIDGVRALPGHDPAQWRLAVVAGASDIGADGEVVGICLCDDSRGEAGDGYVRTLGVVPSARGRGIARWLLRRAADDAIDAGRTGLCLTVDGENVTGATAVYESVGFRTTTQIDVWCYPILPDAKDTAASR